MCERRERVSENVEKIIGESGLKIYDSKCYKLERLIALLKLYIIVNVN